MTCINVEQMFGDKYRITFDQAYSARHVSRAKLDPWMVEIPCQGRGVTVTAPARGCVKHPDRPFRERRPL